MSLKFAGLLYSFWAIYMLAFAGEMYGVSFINGYSGKSEQFNLKITIKQMGIWKWEEVVNNCWSLTGIE